ncbi:type II toxin-antitoxin system Rv0910 family toxin [Nocardia nepalensis]|uniref:type II toxin-antitoxin system Rv0910 family toxin n=1 Tax=Nocardia nepalensis TaxID=3375448 RepID=UPI003B6718F0
MPQIHRTIELTASVDRLWNQLSDINNFSDWMTIHTSFKGAVPAAGEIKVGDSYTEVVTLMGMANTIEWTVREASTPEEVLSAKKGAFKVTGTGMAGVEATIEVGVDGTEGEVTRVDLNALFAGQMLVGAIGNAIDKAVGEELDASLEKLKAAI